MGLTMKVERIGLNCIATWGAHGLPCQCFSSSAWCKRSRPHPAQPVMVNLAIAFLALHIITAYFQALWSMQTTG